MNDIFKITLDDFGKVRIPKEIRKELQLLPGSELSISIKNGDIIISKSDTSFNEDDLL